VKYQARQLEHAHALQSGQWKHELHKLNQHDVQEIEKSTAFVCKTDIILRIAGRFATLWGSFLQVCVCKTSTWVRL
jgi:hypothetical protein